ncbi:glycosyltransferase [Anaerobaca lacustris]|uniref:Glycosyltransferase n=1 Tax=Anaerobaca lacustris TaxID=3044600 RepID=A0AAW6TRC3_9BACT|nr:glycosyltransferase [Sedimentisphaerales bacterium M17dextr]
MQKQVVIHNVMTWVHLTENWLYTQAKYLPDEVESHIVCKSTANLNVFGMRHIHSWSDLPLCRRVLSVFRGLPVLRTHLRQQGAHLLEIARRYDASVVHSHFGYVGWRYMDAVRRAGLGHVVTFYGVDVSRLPQEDPRWKTRYHQLFRKADRVLCEGPHMAGLITQLGCPEQKVEVHHLGIRIDTIPFRPRRRDPAEPLRVLIAASFREKKGIPDALGALGRIRDAVPLEVTIIGDSGSSEEGRREKGRIMAAIEKHRLGSTVRLLGFQPHSTLLEEAYRHHVYLCPSFTTSNGDCEGGAPIGMIEMAGSGMPVVSTRHCDIPEVFGPDGGSLLADERDTDGLARRLLWLAENPEAWDQIIRAARDRVEWQYDAAKQGVRLAGIYRDVAQR